jgi:hypothetical protein
MTMSGAKPHVPVNSPNVLPAGWRPWTVGWLGVLGLAFANGGLHRAYEPALGVLRSEQLSNVTIVAAVVPWAIWMDRRAPTSSAREALEAGLLWGAMTVAFEFIGGHYINGDTWQTLVNAYDVTAGHLWPFAVAGITVAPSLARRWRRS